MSNATGTLNILHVMRAPVGGLFRHVLDLARGQIARGHRVGLIADILTGGAQAEATLRLASLCGIGFWLPLEIKTKDRSPVLCFDVCKDDYGL